MARGIDRTELLELLAETVNNENPMLHLMEFFLGHLMEAEVEVIVGADRSERTEKRKNYRSGYRDRRFDTRLGSMDLKIPKLRTGGYVPCFLNHGKRCEEALIAVVAEAYVSGISTRKKEIWLAPTKEAALARAKEFCRALKKRYPKAVETLENGLEDSLTFYAFPKLDARKISSSNMLEWLNKEFRRRSKVVTVFPSMGAYLRLLTTYVMEYTEDWQKMGRAYLDLSSLQKYVR